MSPCKVVFFGVKLSRLYEIGYWSIRHVEMKLRQASIRVLIFVPGRDSVRGNYSILRKPVARSNNTKPT